ncbi:MAG: hypothetical protein FJ276_19650 [Planctomycetes bacterium]|nr:hypothetical protein [Planctomycetota bacterium]
MLNAYRPLTILVALLALLAVGGESHAQQAVKTEQSGARGNMPAGEADTGAAPASGAPAAKEAALPADLLLDEQARLADKYRRLEDLIFNMAALEANSNPARAKLLTDAYRQSKDRLTQAQLNSIVTLLTEKKYKRALDGQEVARKDFQDLLQILLTEDRSERMKSEVQKITEYVKELKRLERLQRSLRGRTEGGSDAEQLAKSQGQVADRTGELADKLEKTNLPAGQDTDSSEQPPKPSDSEESPGKRDGGDEDAPGKDDQRDDDTKQAGGDAQPGGDPKPGKPSDSSQSQDKSGESDGGKPSGAQPQDSQAPSENQNQPPSEGQGGDSGQQPDQQPPPRDESPAEKRVREAEQKMREAQRELEAAKRSESVEKQNEALEKLQEAIKELEEVLRQLREEEVERVLALLEGRFRRMLEMQVKVYEATASLSELPPAERGRNFDVQANQLAFDERKIVAEADRCLNLLLEEGSSVAFPEVVEQMRDDMEEVSSRLGKVLIDQITLGLEEEIIAALEEMIAALRKAQQDKDERSPPPGRPSQPGEMPLVDMLAEIKMIRSLQWRVNQRTRGYARMLADMEDPIGLPQDEDLRAAIRQLSEREAKIQRITRDIVLGRNK